MVSWLPLYLLHEQKIDIRSIGMRTAVCYVLAACGAIVLGRVLERMVFRPNAGPGRRRFAVVACLAGAPPIGLLPHLHAMTPILAVLSVSLCCLIATNGASTATLTDLVEDGQTIGSIIGVTLTFSNLLGLPAPS